MSVTTFILYLVIAGIAAGAWVLIGNYGTPDAGRRWTGFAGAFVFGALLLVLPAILPKLLGGG